MMTATPLTPSLASNPRRAMGACLGVVAHYHLSPTRAGWWEVMAA